MSDEDISSFIEKERKKIADFDKDLVDFKNISDCIAQHMSNRGINDKLHTHFFCKAKLSVALDREYDLKHIRSYDIWIPSLWKTPKGWVYVLADPHMQKFSKLHPTFFQRAIREKGWLRKYERGVVMVYKESVRASGITSIFAKHEYDDKNDFIIEGSVKVQDPCKFVANIYKGLEGDKMPQTGLIHELKHMFNTFGVYDHRCGPDCSAHLDYNLERLLIAERSRIVKTDDIKRGDSLIKKIADYYSQFGINISDMHIYRRVPIGFEHEVAEPRLEADARAEEREYVRKKAPVEAERELKVLEDSEAISVEALTKTLKNQGFNKKQIERIIGDVKRKYLY